MIERNNTYCVLRHTNAFKLTQKGNCIINNIISFLGTENDPSSNICPPGFSGFLPDPLSCSSFYQCVVGRPIRFTCVTGTEFDVASGVSIIMFVCVCVNFIISSILNPSV